MTGQATSAWLIDEKPTEEVELVEATCAGYRDRPVTITMLSTKRATDSYRRCATMKSSPWIVARYMKVAGEVYGRGPLVTAIPDIKTLNKTLELLLLKNASLSIAGVYTAADDGVLNPQTISISAGCYYPGCA